MSTTRDQLQLALAQSLMKQGGPAGSPLAIFGNLARQAAGLQLQRRALDDIDARKQAAQTEALRLLTPGPSINAGILDEGFEPTEVVRQQKPSMANLISVATNENVGSAFQNLAAQMYANELTKDRTRQQQNFTAGESQMQRDFTAAQSAAQRGFTAEQNRLSRDATLNKPDVIQTKTGDGQVISNVFRNGEFVKSFLTGKPKAGETIELMTAAEIRQRFPNSVGEIPAGAAQDLFDVTIKDGKYAGSEKRYSEVTPQGQSKSQAMAPANITPQRPLANTPENVSLEDVTGVFPTILVKLGDLKDAIFGGELSDKQKLAGTIDTLKSLSQTVVRDLQGVTDSRISNLAIQLAQEIIPDRGSLQSAAKFREKAQNIVALLEQRLPDLEKLAQGANVNSSDKQAAVQSYRNLDSVRASYAAILKGDRDANMPGDLQKQIDEANKIINPGGG